MTGAPGERRLAELEAAQLIGSVAALDELVAHIDGVMNLLTKAYRAVDRGTPADRATALSLVDRAERYIPEDDGDDQRRSGIVQMRAAVADARERALALPD